MWLFLYQSYFHILHFTLLSINKILLHYYIPNLPKANLAFVVTSWENPAPESKPPSSRFLKFSLQSHYLYSPHPTFYIL